MVSNSEVGLLSGGARLNLRFARDPLAIGEHEQASLPVPYRSDLALTGSIIVGGPNQSELCTVLFRKTTLSRSRHRCKSG